MLSDDLKSRKLIVFKGLLFALCIAMSAGLILAENYSVRTAVLLVLLIWASARFYYFLFYVLHAYVDPSLKYAGMWSLIRAILTRR
jgi:hypothetical protein